MNFYLPKLHIFLLIINSILYKELLNLNIFHKISKKFHILFFFYIKLHFICHLCIFLKCSHFRIKNSFFSMKKVLFRTFLSVFRLKISKIEFPLLKIIHFYFFFNFLNKLTHPKIPIKL